MATLTESQRTKLDGIVQQMIQNKESDADIKAVVEDYKSRASAEPVAQQKGIFGRAVDMAKNLTTDVAADLKQRGINIGEATKRRWDINKDITERELTGQQGFLSTAYQSIGNAAGFIASDILGEVLGGAVKGVANFSSAVRSGDKTRSEQYQSDIQSFKDLGKYIAQTETGGRMIEQGANTIEEIVGRWNDFAEKNPVAAANIAATGNLADFVATFAAPGLIKNAGKEAVTAVETASKSLLKRATTPIKGAIENLSEQVAKSRVKDAYATGKKLTAETGQMLKSTVGQVPSRVMEAGQEALERSKTISKLSVPGQEAVRSGIALRDVKIIENASGEEQKIFKEMLDQAKAFSEDRSVADPSDVAGAVFKKRIEEADVLRKEIGDRLGKAVEQFGPGDVSSVADDVFMRLRQTPGFQGIARKADGTLDFSRTVKSSEFSRADQDDIQKLFNALNGRDAVQLHNLRQEIFDLLGGRKQASVVLTGTQEKAMNSVRQGIADTLEEISPTYREINKEYAKVAEPLKRLRKFFKGLENAPEDILDERAGTLMRRLTSNAPSAQDLSYAIQQIDDVLKASGKEQPIDLTKLQDFANSLNRYFDITRDTSLAGQVNLANTPLSAKGLLQRVINKAGEFLQPSDLSRQKALEKLIAKKVGGFVSTGPIKTEDRILAKAFTDYGDDLTASIKQAKASGQSFDEWVKGQGETVYHGTNYENFDPKKAVSKDGQYGKGVYFASDKNITKQYGSKTIEAVLDINSLLKIDEPLTATQKTNLRKVMGGDEWDWRKNPTGEFVWKRLELTKKNPEELLKKAGIKGIQHKQFTSGGENINYTIFDDSAIKTRSQLKAEWDKN
jgi:hypothetical protein